MLIFIYVLNGQFEAGDSSLSSQTRIEPYTVMRVLNATETTTLAAKWDSDRVLGFYSKKTSYRMKS